MSKLADDLRWKIVADMLRERDRQTQLKAAGRFKFTCADYDPNGAFTNPDRYLILAEEVGEVAREVLINKGLVEGQDRGWKALREELIQVMAIALAWIEYLDAPESGL